ncbi:hypothetical protein [Pseudomonas sp. MF6747]|uniref:hypothetical protein n=1 Tax=Pseudomonas sp. MF6747 TaxID=2797527 RepID=UPI001A2C8BC1|nr:hypothetical protein [Pseudomonas sp. MF6747]
MNYNKGIYSEYLRLTVIPLFIATDIFLVIKIPEQTSTLEWKLLFLMSIFLSIIITIAYSIVIVFIELILKDIISGHKTKEMLFISKPKAQFKIVQHTNNSQIKHLKENRTKFYERNNRTMRRRINTRRNNI